MIAQPKSRRWNITKIKKKFITPCNLKNLSQEVADWGKLDYPQNTQKEPKNVINAKDVWERIVGGSATPTAATIAAAITITFS